MPVADDDAGAFRRRSNARLWTVYVGEDHDDHTALWERFEVNR
jgi:hypothetical protein